MANQSGKYTSGIHTSYWLDSVPSVSFKKLENNMDTDVVIVGGGIAGVSVAYGLILSGKKVILIEDGIIGSGETGRSTAHLVTALDDRYYEFERLFGKKKTKLIAESHSRAIDFIERTVDRENIDCEFERVNGYLFLNSTDKSDSLLKEYDAATRAGVSVEKTISVPAIAGVNAALKFNGQAQFHPLKYINALCKIIVNRGGKIYNRTHANEIDETGVLTSDGFRINAKHVVICTNSPVNNKYAMHLKQYAYRTYVIAAKIKKGSIAPALWWDTGNFSTSYATHPYHYARVQKFNENYDLLIAGGEDHPTGLAEIEKISEEERYVAVEKWARKFFPAIEDVIYKWSGQILEPMDHLGYIGNNPYDKSNVYIVTGDSGNGLTNAVIAGMLIPDLINGKPNEWTELYDPARIKLAAGGAFLKEFVGGFINYLKTKPNNKKGVQPEHIPKNEGVILKYNRKEYGVFKDENGDLHWVDAACSHLGCTVKWNNDEKTWDCPCHGSRFTYKGEILNGPAIRALAYHKIVYGFKYEKK
jgi:glycine/D-amino acid oxidase-like deaminating enzyme/nitrite reductase/ring-hydroxylating ferredoxin subunit